METFGPNSDSERRSSVGESIGETFQRISFHPMAVPLERPSPGIDKNLNRNDREEIRRRLAMGFEFKDQLCDRVGRKSTLQSRLQNGMKLQICFMNETVCDTDSQNGYYSGGETCTNSAYSGLQRKNLGSEANRTSLQSLQTSSALGSTSFELHDTPLLNTSHVFSFPENFATQQARLQREARMALNQAKEMSRMQIKLEREQRKRSPISDMVRISLEKAGVIFPADKRRMNRRVISELNVAQLQVVVNDLHCQIEALNKELVDVLMKRDDLHMEQDSMLVDIEDLSRYLCSYYAKSNPVL